MKINACDPVLAQSRPTFKEVQEGGLSWREQKKILKRTRENEKMRYLDEQWWRNASEWQRLKRTVADFFKNLLKK